MSNGHDSGDGSGEEQSDKHPFGIDPNDAPDAGMSGANAPPAGNGQRMEKTVMRSVQTQGRIDIPEEQLAHMGVSQGDKVVLQYDTENETITIAGPASEVIDFD